MTNDTGQVTEPEHGRRSQIIEGLTELALLSLLNEEPCYGLDILERLCTEAGLMLAEGAVYPLLRRLEKAGWTAAEWRIEGGTARANTTPSPRRAGTNSRSSSPTGGTCPADSPLFSKGPRRDR